MSRFVLLFFATFFAAASLFAQDFAPAPPPPTDAPSSLDYVRPDVSGELNESYTLVGTDAVREEVGADVSGWWSQIVADEALASLTKEAVPRNPTLREATFRVQAARAAFEKETRNLERLPANATPTERELAKRRLEAAKADMEIQRELYRDAYVDLIADVAATYVVVRSSQEQIRNALWNARVQKRAVRRAEANAAAGVASTAEIARARGPLNVAEASLSTFDAQLQQALNRLSFLAGRPVGYVDDMLSVSNDDIASLSDGELEALTSEILNQTPNFARSVANPTRTRGKSAAEPQTAVEKATDEFFLDALDEILPNLIPEAPSEISVGVPADLLRRRPDIRAAEQRMIAQNARRAIATLEARLAAEKSSNDAPSAENFDVAAARFEFEATIARYRNLVLEAQREVEDALVVYAGRSPDPKARRDAFETTLRTQFAHSAGRGDFGAVLETRSQLGDDVGARFIENKTRRVLALVELYRALGGDWFSNPSFDANAETDAKTNDAPDAENADAPQAH